MEVLRSKRFDWDLVELEEAVERAVPAVEVVEGVGIVAGIDVVEKDIVEDVVEEAFVVEVVVVEVVVVEDVVEEAFVVEEDVRPFH